MKLRIKGNSLRLRLSKTEVQQLSKKNIIAEMISFGDSMLGYSLTAKTGIEKPEALFTDNNIIVSVPDTFAAAWPDNQIVGTDCEQEIGENIFLKILIEKDFQCLDENTEDQSDNYINPNSTC